MQGFHASYNGLPQFDALPRGDTQQISGTPYDILLELIYLPVRVNDFPHHLNDAATSFVVKRFIERPGETIEIDRVSRERLGVDDQPGGRDVVKSIARLQHGVQLGSSRWR